MKPFSIAHPFRRLGLLFSLPAMLWFAGCCDGEIIISGKIRDAYTGASLDSVRVSLFYRTKKEVESSIFEYSDSTGYFLIWDFGYCGNTDFFLLVSKPGYLSKSIDVEFHDDNLEINLIPD